MDNTSQASTQFGLELLQLVNTENANGFISPFSLSVALGMTQLGAGGETSKGMMKGLRWQEGKESTIHEENQKYITLLQQSHDQYTLSVANRLFVEKEYTLLPEFLEKTQKLYLAETVSSHFRTNAEKERVDINSWVSDQTKERIKDLLAPGILNADTRMVLVNAIYFKGLWTSPFEARSTQPMPFKVSPQSTKNVPTMMGEKSLRFWFGGKEGFSALELPYKGDALSMVILLPKDDFGLAEMEKNLSHDKLATVFARLMHPDKIKVRLPKFEMTCTYEMKEPLCHMGMATAFHPVHADFSHMTPNSDLFISEVVHKAFIKVDEEGSEAAAATAVVMMLKCAMVPEKVPEFFVDHPFFFVIRDKRASNSILFMGRVTAP